MEAAKEEDASEDSIEDIIVIKDLDAMRVEGKSVGVKDAGENDVFVVKDLDAIAAEKDVRQEQDTTTKEDLELEGSEKAVEDKGVKDVKEDIREEVKEDTKEVALVAKDLDAKVELEIVVKEEENGKRMAEIKAEKEVDARVEVDAEAEDAKKEVEIEVEESATSKISNGIEKPSSSSPPSPPSSEIGEDIEEAKEQKGEETPSLAPSVINDTPGNDRCVVGSRPATAANSDREVNKNEETSTCSTSTSPRHSRAISPTPIGNNNHTHNQEKRFPSTATDFERNAPNTPPATPPRVVRRERSASQREREILRSRQFSESARLQRSAERPEKSEEELALGRRRKRYQHRHKSKGSISGSGEALKALEPLHEHQLGKMAFAEQQQWITVQQKTFTKW